MSGGSDSLPAVEVVRLPHAVALPAYATPGAAGADLCAALPENQPMTLAPGARALVPTGLRLAIAPGYEAQVRPRSGLALRLGVTVLNAPGTIDSDYRGELGVILVNHGQAPATIQRGDRIAQLVIAPAPQAVFREVEAIEETARGEGGFGSTGLGESLPPVQQQQQQDAGGRSGPKEE